MSLARRCDRVELACAYVLGALPAGEVGAVESHVTSCAECRREVDSLRPVIERLVDWPSDAIQPPDALQKRLAERIGAASLPVGTAWPEPQWRDVAPGISVQMLSTEAETGMVSMLVRLAPGGEYPPHRHAGIEELHLLDGELWIDERKLYPGDYNRAEPGTGDQRVWSETGCLCVLVTSSRDPLS